MMRSLMWLMTLSLTFAAMGVGADGRFAGASTVAYALAFLAFLACPLLWGQPGSIVPAGFAMPAKTRLMLAATLIVGSPLMLPWQLWL